MADPPIEEIVAPAEQREQAELLVRLGTEQVDADGVDPHSTWSDYTFDDLATDLRDADHTFIAYSSAADSCGYGLTRHWVEVDGTHVHLLDAWAVPDRIGTWSRLSSSIDWRPPSGPKSRRAAESSSAPIVALPNPRG